MAPTSALRVAEQVLVVASASVSFAGCAFIFFTWKSFSAPNYISRRIVASLGLAGLVTAFGFAMYVCVVVLPRLLRSFACMWWCACGVAVRMLASSLTDAHTHTH